jgi:hypothetical protein
MRPAKMLAIARRWCVLESPPVHHSQLPLTAAPGFGGGSLGPRCVGGTLRRGGDADPAVDCRPDSRSRSPRRKSGSEKIFNTVDMLEMWIQMDERACERRHSSRVRPVRFATVRTARALPEILSDSGAGFDPSGVLDR